MPNNEIDTERQHCDVAFVPPHLAIKAMRSSGYKNAAYAVAELLDNSIQAGAQRVELLCFDGYQNNQKHIEKIAVLDDGAGMSLDNLQLCLQFGNGTRLQPDKQTGLGKFGMGLPSASISQCKLVEVFSWQNGVDSVYKTYMDIEKILNGELTSVPKPEKASLPDFITNIKDIKIGKSGTLVLWSRIDKCLWKQGVTVIKNSEDIIGRIYRYYLNEKLVTIRMSAIDFATRAITDERLARPNDPLYLMTETTCPSPYNEKPMFDVYYSDKQYKITYNSKVHFVSVRFAYAKKEAREIANDGTKAGDKAYGKHASKNQGVSILRAGREIELNSTLCNGEPTERWWGVEVDFPPALDDVFGVTNNKQSAHNFAELMGANLEEDWAADSGHSVKYQTYLREIGDPKADLVGLIQKIKTMISSMRSLLKKQNEGQKVKRNIGSGAISLDGSEETATIVSNRRTEKGNVGLTDKSPPLSAENAAQIHIDELEDAIPDLEIRTEVANFLAEKNLKYTFQSKNMDGHGFFAPSQRAGHIYVYVNSNHPAYEEFFKVLDPIDDENPSNEDLKIRLQQALRSIKLLLMAWARLEDESADSDRVRLHDIRQSWGQMARDFLIRRE